MKKGYQVKTDATERVNQIVELYLSKANKDQHISQAAGEGKTVAQMLVDYQGDLPVGSGCFHELVSDVVDRLSGIYITHNERESEEILHQLIEEDQYYILATGFYKRRVNEFNQRYTQELIAEEIFKISDNAYKYTLERIRLEIIDIDQRTRAVKRAA